MFKTASPLLAAAVLSAGLCAPAAATLVTFDDTVAAGSFISPALPYLEQGFQLRNGTTGSANALLDADFLGLGRASDYFGWNANSEFVLESASGAAFELMSMDLASLYSNTDALSFVVLGTLAGGGNVFLAGTLSNFATQAFDASWTNLASVTVWAADPSVSGAVDNINVRLLPEPTSLALAGLALLGLGALRRRSAA
jgi:hypothetical protein